MQKEEWKGTRIRKALLEPPTYCQQEIIPLDGKLYGKYCKNRFAHYGAASR